MMCAGSFWVYFPSLVCTDAVNDEGSALELSGSSAVAALAGAILSSETCGAKTLGCIHLRCGSSERCLPLQGCRLRHD